MIFALLFIISSILAIIYLNGLYNERYWKKRGVTFYNRNKTFGIVWDYLTKNRSLFEYLNDIYKQYPNEPAVGIGSFLTPALYVRDPVNIQYVLSKNFNAFNHRGVEINEGDLLADNILFQHGEKWKLVRQSMTPLFTSAKLKSMYYIIDKSVQDFIRYLKDDAKLAKGNTFTNLSTFCSAAMCASVFGVTSKSIFDSPFLNLAQNALRAGFKRNIKFAIANISKSLFKLLNIKFFKEHEDFFIGAIKKVIHQRKSDNVKKHDFADICVALQSKGLLKEPVSGLELEPTDELLAAQAFFFFIAGVEPTAAAMFATLVELGRHPEHLQRLQEEINETFEKYDGKLTYEAVTSMEYLDRVICEGIRLHPPVGFLTRQCVRDTVLPVGNIKIDKGTKIFTPIYEVHHDPKYHVDPEDFNPNRFSPENRALIADIAYVPFGKGNRVCIGMRYAQLQAKSGLVHLLRHFSVKTHIFEGGIQYQKEQVQVRLKNVRVELVLRDKEN
ncbi:unnamed protein product, partial [Brenthis ino]